MNKKKINFKAGLQAGFVVLIFYIAGIIFIEIAHFNEIISLIFSLLICITLSFLMFGSKWRKTFLERRMQNNIDDILGTLYDPEEILEQTETQKIKKIIEIFNKTGYENISIEYEKFIKNQKYDFTDLPAPEDISEDFKRRYLELLNNGEIYIT